MTSSSAPSKIILLIISGSISAYKALEVIRRLKKKHYEVRTIITKGGAEFITPLSVAALSEHPVYSDLFCLKDEAEMGHIRLSREADVIAVIPASANMIADMAAGRSNSLATAVLLATNPKETPVFFAPAMNPNMWNHPATQRNIAQCISDGLRMIEPDSGLMACGEVGAGRLAEVDTIVQSVEQCFYGHALAGKHIIITAGGTKEAIDPVRYIGNHSSGKQALAIAEACIMQGAQVTFIYGAIRVDIPAYAQSIYAPSADDMKQAVEKALPADIVICAAAVADWKAKHKGEQKLKKTQTEDILTLTFEKTSDILKYVSQHLTQRPELVIGFAAETETVIEHAISKRQRKKCDWILANDVSQGAVFGKDKTHVHFISRDHSVDWGKASKTDIAKRLTDEIITYYSQKH